MENVLQDKWDSAEDRPGFLWNRMRLGRRLGGELLGASVFQLGAGQKSFPYHFHHANEELLLVLEGAVVLRTPDGLQPMGPGDAELFPRGAGGAHQVLNESSEPARYIMFSSMVDPEIAEYPDSGNIGVFSRRLSATADQPALHRYLDGSAERDYFLGEDLP